MSNERGSNWKNWVNKAFGNNFGSFRGGHGRGGRGFSRGGHRNFRNQAPYGGNFRGGNRGSFGNRGGGNQHWKNRPRRETPGKRLCEEEIGVTEYISNHVGFSGIIKSRYSDFQVSEINEQGEVAKLTDLSPPAPPTEEAVDEDEDLLLCKYNVEILPMDTWDQINKIAVCSEPSEEKVEIDVTGMSKEQRTKIHDAVKKAFGDSIVGSTVNIDDKKFVRFEKFRKGVRIDNRVKWVWPGEYVYFIVHKENCDTMDAAVRIAERLRLNIKPSMLGYAGTKDRRAKTSQWFSLRKVDPRRVAAACRDLRDIRIGNFAFRNTNLRLGMLRGNKFRIALRNVTVPDEVVATACAQLKECGFINYYGLQRFGSRADTPTYDIGLKLLQGNFKEAIAGILEVREGPLQAALHSFRTEGAAAALRAWPRRATNAAAELRLLRALAHSPNDLLGALNKLARNNRLLYLHSYQSLVWNRCVSERVKRFGLEPAVGDLVPLSKDEIDEEIEEEEEDDASDNESTNDDKQDGDEDKMADAPKLPENALETSIKQVKQKIPVRVLTQEEIDSGKYTILDIILPLPGHMIEYPPNMKEYYEELLAKDGLNLEMRHKFKSYSMSGAYRHMAIRPLDVSWRCVRYTDPFADLILSDWDQLEARTLDGIVEDGKYKALLLEMTLPASCYATMALRELLKVDTSSDNQAQQNNYHKKDKEDVKDQVKSETDEGGSEGGNAEKRKLNNDEDATEVKKFKQETDQ